MKSVHRSAALLLAFGFLFSSLLAQRDAGAIVGTVLDASGAAVSGATVKVINVGTNISVSLTTGNDGVFVTPPLQIGTYRVEAEATGFKRTVRDDIVLRVQ